MFHSMFKGKTVLQAGIIAASLFLFTVAAAKEDLPEIDSDGLHLVKDSKVRILYARPGIDLGQFDKVMILDAFVDFKKGWERDYNMDQLGLSGRVSDKDLERIKADLAAEFRKVFTETLTENGHEVVSTEGAGVLLLRPAIINLDVTAPDVMRSSRGNTWIESAGEMTLYMEIYNSATGELIGRAVDPREDQRMGAQMANKVTNKAAADRIIKHWALLLSDALTAAKQGG
jgi:Protein of unknown function (DUF3313)